MGASDAALAWEYLRRSPDYCTVWEAYASPHAFEDAPFPIRVQGETDLAAARFALLAWQEPLHGGGTASPFWAVAPMLEGELVEGARPLLPLLARAGACIDGLRLCDGALVLKIERGERAAQVRIPRIGPFPADCGLVVRLDYGLPLPVVIERLRDLWSLAHGPAPQRGRVRGEEIASF